jgi:hypothetical protein
MQHAMTQAIFAAVRFDVTEQLQRDQQSSNGGAREFRRARYVRDRQTLRMAVERFDHAQAARERQHEIRIAFVYGKIRSPARAKARNRGGLVGGVAWRRFRRNRNFHRDLS